jgi:hypothetical protein
VPVNTVARPIRECDRRSARVMAGRPPPYRDPVAQLFDQVKVAGILSAALDPVLLRAGPIHEVRVERCWPAGDSGLRFEWSFHTGGARRQTVYGSCGDAVDDRDRRAADRGRTTSRGWRDVSVFMADYGLLIHTPDRDRELPQLAALLGRDSSVPIRRSQAVRLLSYKPARRAALRFDFGASNGGANRIMGKTFRDNRGARLLDVHRQIQRHLNEVRDGRCRVPDALEFVPESKLALFAWVPGRAAPRGRALSDVRLFAAMDVLANLHTVEIPGLPHFSRDEELRIVHRWLNTLTRIEPRRAERGRALVDSLECLARRLEPRPPATIHRDFYEKQIAWNGRTTTLLDLDTLATGDPELDLGNFMGHLYLHQSQAAVENSPRFDDLSDLFASLSDRYQICGRTPDRKVVAFYCASSLIRGGALHSLRTATRSFAAGMWRLARAILAEEVRP